MTLLPGEWLKAVWPPISDQRPAHRYLSRLWFTWAMLVLAAVSASCSEFVVDIDVEQNDVVTDAVAEDPEVTVDDSDVVDSDVVGDGPGLVVERVVDGDSLEVLVLPDRTPVEVRLVGYNAPELYADDTQTCNGKQARDALEVLVEDAQGLVLLDEGTDRYGRQLADIALGDDDGSATAVAALISAGRGLATGTSEANRRLMVEAAEAGRGIWGDQCGTPMTDGLVIAEAQVDPEGNDRFNLADEWVRIKNVSGQSIALDGWILRDDTTGHRFGLSGALSSGSSLTVRTGDGSSDDDDLFLGERYPVWSNEWETVILVDPNGVVAHWRFIG